MERTIHSLPRVLRGLLPGCAFLLLTLAVLSPACADTAHTPSLKVAIKQINPDGAVQTVNCTLLQKNCDLPFVINAGTPAQQSVSIHVVYFNGGVAVDFQTSGGYFYTASTIGGSPIYSLLWKGGIRDNAPATLFQPLAPAPVTMAAPNVSYTSVASLEISATPVP